MEIYTDNYRIKKFENQSHVSKGLSIWIESLLQEGYLNSEFSFYLFDFNKCTLTILDKVGVNKENSYQRLLHNSPENREGLKRNFDLRQLSSSTFYCAYNDKDICKPLTITNPNLTYILDIINLMSS